MAMSITWVCRATHAADGFGASQTVGAPGYASDFYTVAVGAGLEGRGSGGEYGAGVVHPSTGVLMQEYPLSWLGVRGYQVQEIGLSRLPPRFANAAPDSMVRVLHTPDEICKEAFIRTAYQAPCVQAWHPEQYHSRYSPVEICGMLGTSHRLVDTPLGQVPVVPAGIYAARAQDAIRGGADGSSLSYAYSLRWAEQLGDMRCGDKVFRAVQDYDVMHVMGTVNHMVVACSVNAARGKLASSARLIFDCDTRPALCYGPAMRINIPDKAAKAIARDMTVEIPDDTPRPVVDLLQVLVTGIQQAIDQRDGMAGQVAAAEESVNTMQEQVAAADLLLFTHRQQAIREMIKVAADLGVKVAPKFKVDMATGSDGKRTPVVEDPNGVDSVIAVKRLVVDHRAKAAGKPIAQDMLVQDGYVEAKWESALEASKGRASGEAQDTTPGGIPKINASKLEDAWRSKRPNPQPAAAKAKA
jgi:hypothetical protein